MKFRYHIHIINIKGNNSLEFKMQLHTYIMCTAQPHTAYTKQSGLPLIISNKVQEVYTLCHSIKYLH